MGSSNVASKSTLARKDTDVRMYLVTDAGFLQTTLRSVVCLLILLAGCYAYRPLRLGAIEAYEWIKLQMLEAAHRMAWWSLLGLLSSSCCVIQILLNALSLGCSGLNSILGPIRPHFIAMTLVTNAISLYVAYPLPFQWAPAAAGCALSMVLMFTPEMLAAYTYRYKIPRDPKTEQEKIGTSAIRLKLKNGAMGCISCVGKVCSVAQRNQSVLTSTVDFENALVSAHIYEEPGQAADAIALALEKALYDNSFPVESWTVEKLEDEQLANACAKDTQPATPLNKENKLSNLMSWTQVVGAGLLGSSCCLIQLVVNMLTALSVIQGIGCTGFNTILGPVRPQLRIATAAWLVFFWYNATKRGWRKSLLITQTVIFLFLTFLPEILVVTGGPALAPPTSDVQVLKFKVDGMGCEACQTHVKSMIEQWGGVVASDVDFKKGSAEVHVAKGWGDGKGGFEFEQLQKQLEIDGYSIEPEVHWGPRGPEL